MMQYKLFFNLLSRHVSKTSACNVCLFFGTAIFFLIEKSSNNLLFYQFCCNFA